MIERDIDSVNDTEFEEMLISSVSDIPPENIARSVTPWKRAVRRILIGTALNVLTLNFLALNYILPTIGVILCLLGFRTLRSENGQFRACYILIWIRALYAVSTLCLNATIYQSTVYATTSMKVVSACSIALVFALLVCFASAVREVRKRAGFERGSSGTAGMIIWYFVLVLLALVEYRGFIIAIAMIAAFVLLARSMWQTACELECSGYVVKASAVRISDSVLIAILALLIALGISLGYIFFSRYPMEWTPIDKNEHEGLADIKEHLYSLGFPEYVADDLSIEDLEILRDAVEVKVDVDDHPLNDGREVTEYSYDASGKITKILRRTVFDVNELRLTKIAVRLPDSRDVWRIIFHFEWIVVPKNSTTDSIQLWRTEGWLTDGEVSGRLLYDCDGMSNAAEYAFLGEVTYTQKSVIFGESTENSVFASFSMPKNGERHRGYLSYSIKQGLRGGIIDEWLNYTHAESWVQYPALTAMEQRIKSAWNNESVFITVQDAIQFFPSQTDE